MKAFEVPEVEVVFFGKNDIITTSTCDSNVCDCDNCPGGCPEGSNNCPCVDAWSSDYKG